MEEEAPDQDVLSFLRRSSREVSQREIQLGTGKSLPQVRAALGRLVAAGAVRAEGQTAARRFWALAEPIRRRARG